jgi:hypothetical protein
MRTLRVAVVMVLIGIVGPSARALDGPCKLATKGNSRVAKACVKGGAKQAKKEMEAIKKEVKQATGRTLECSECHDAIDNGRYDVLKKDGRKRFDQLMASLKS